MSSEEKALPQVSDALVWPSLDEISAATRETAREAMEDLKRKGIIVVVDGRLYCREHDPRRAGDTGATS